MPTIPIEGLGVFHFPEDMSQEAVAAEVARLKGEAGGASGPVRSSTAPLAAPSAAPTLGQRALTLARQLGPAAGPLGLLVTPGLSRSAIPAAAEVAALTAGGALGGPVGAGGAGVAVEAARELPAAWQKAQTLAPRASLPARIALTAAQLDPTALATMGGVNAALEGAPGVLRAVAGRLYQSALKPSLAAAALPKVKTLVQTGLREAIPIGRNMAARATTRVGDLMDQIAEQIQNLPTSPGVEVARDIAPVVQRLSDRTAQQNVPQPDLAAVNATWRKFLEQWGTPGRLSPVEAQALKQGTYRSLGERAYARPPGAPVPAGEATEQAIAAGERQGLERLADAQAVAEGQPPGLLAARNRRAGDLLELASALERAGGRIGNWNPLASGRNLFALGLGGGTYGLTQDPTRAAEVALAARLAESPAVLSRAGIGLSKIAPAAPLGLRALIVNALSGPSSP